MKISAVPHETFTTYRRAGKVLSATPTEMTVVGSVEGEAEQRKLVEADTVQDPTFAARGGPGNELRDKVTEQNRVAEVERRLEDWRRTKLKENEVTPKGLEELRADPRVKIEGDSGGQQRQVAQTHQARRGE